LMEIIRLGSLREGGGYSVGGKAQGLDFMKKHGYRIADGFVVISADEVTEQSFTEIERAFDELGAERVSVRSSATNEDGGEFSNAGQYETCLNVTRDGLKDAVLRCVASLEGERAQDYADKLLSGERARMNVVVEQMIDARHAGVMFTCDPADKTHVLIESVDGLGENLVSGAVSSYSYSIPKSGYCYGDGNLSDEELKRIYEEGLEISREYGNEADLEWAVDGSGQLYWLQLRPITTLDEADKGEFNTKNPLEKHLITTRNIGEMLPGAVTPLSISTSVLALDYGIRNMIKQVGGIKKVSDRPDYYTAFPYNYHLFFDMSAIYDISLSVVMADPKSMNVSIMGEYYEDYPRPTKPKMNVFKRLVNGVRMFKYLFSSKKARKNITALFDGLQFSGHTDVNALYAEIDEKLPAMNEALCYHYVCSAFSGSMNSALFMTVSDVYKERAEYQAFVSSILSDIDGIESADILRSLKRLAKEILAVRPDAAKMDVKQLLEFVEDKSNTAVNACYTGFLQKHGHRSIKEAELRSKAWKNDPDALMKNLSSVIASGKVEDEDRLPFDIKPLIKEFKGIKRSVIKWIGGKARQAVTDREYSKSYIIKVIDKFKDEYARLARLLVKEGLLADEDSIYFLSHEEIGRLISGESALKRKALSRRTVFTEAEDDTYADVCIGAPTPIDTAISMDGESVHGIPVCKGKVYGRARIVKTFEDAGELQKGEIMVAPFTDIGWSPYYSLVGALVTEVGSALSHGAVVAREYCLPTVVNAKNATKRIRTGDFLLVDATKGVITVVSEEEYLLSHGEKADPLKVAV